MKKSFKGLACAVAFTMSAALLAGCGNSDGFKDSNAMSEKFGAYCELGEYKGLSYEGTDTEITDDMIQEKVNSFIEEYATEEDVTEGTANNGDTVNIDFVGSIDGVEFDGGSTEGAGYDLELGAGGMIDGFEEQIVGHDVGENFDIKVTFPEDYGNTDLNGKEAVFNITINSLKTKTYPEYNDEFVAANTDYTTCDEYEASVKTELEAEYAESDKSAKRSSIIQLVIDNTTINEFPTQETEALINETIEDVKNAATSYGYDYETYVTAVYGMDSEESFKEFVGEQAKNFLEEKIIICAIADAEGIEVSKDDIEEYANKLVEQYQLESREALDQYYDSDDLMYYTLAEKVADWLIDNNTAVAPAEDEAEELEVETE